MGNTSSSTGDNKGAKGNATGDKGSAKSESEQKQKQQQKQQQQQQKQQEQQEHQKQQDQKQQQQQKRKEHVIHAGPPDDYYTRIPILKPASAPPLILHSPVGTQLQLRAVGTIALRAAAVGTIVLRPPALVPILHPVLACSRPAGHFSSTARLSGLLLAAATAAAAAALAWNTLSTQWHDTLSLPLQQHHQQEPEASSSLAAERTTGQHTTPLTGRGHVNSSTAWLDLLAFDVAAAAKQQQFEAWAREHSLRVLQSMRAELLEKQARLQQYEGLLGACIRGSTWHPGASCDDLQVAVDALRSEECSLKVLTEAVQNSSMT